MAQYRGTQPGSYVRALRMLRGIRPHSRPYAIRRIASRCGYGLPYPLRGRCARPVTSVRHLYNRRYFVKCDIDGFINWSRPYEQFARALYEAQRLDLEAPGCGPHTVTAEQWVPPAEAEADNA
jgi:hypothetical protein